MSLSSVRISEEVWLTCVTHALTTETEEIMGLLLGDIQRMNGGNGIALIWGASPQMRSDRRKDRVETNPELLAAASAQADRMTLTTGRTTRVIGWYHSHPRHTVLPSHVDVRTQAMYQLLDPGFVGLIFSCFSEDAQKAGRIQAIAFQSLDGNLRQVSSVTNSSVVEIESSWSSSNNASSTSAFALTENFEKDTGDSKVAKGTKVAWAESYEIQTFLTVLPLSILQQLHIFRGSSSGLVGLFSNHDANYLGKQRPRENSIVPYNTDNLQNTVTDMDSPDMTASMQEALHRSTMDVSAAEYVRKEVPFQVLPSKAMLKLDSPLASFVDMQHVLFDEEQSAFKNAIAQNMSDGKIHPLAYIHHTSTYRASLCKLMEYCLSPAVNALQDHLKENDIRLALLLEEAKLLELEAQESESHRHLPSPRSRTSSGTGQANMQASADTANPRSPSAIGSRRKVS